jgi:hypothetical protein
MKKFSVVSYMEYVCPCCGVKKVSEVKDTEDKVYCSRKHEPREMRKKFKCEVAR